MSALKTPAPPAAADANKTAPLPKFSLETKQEEQKTATTTTIQPSQMLSNLRGKTMQEILNEWQSELQNSLAAFHRKATDIARIDTRLIENSEKICKLVTESNEIQSTQTNLLSTLDYIESQQQQLDKELDGFESKLQSVLATHPSAHLRQQQQQQRHHMASPYSGLSADEEREKTFELAESLNLELTHLNRQINETIESVNQIWKKSLPSQGNQTVCYVF